MSDWDTPVDDMPRVYTCAQCEEATPTECTDKKARELGFWSLGDTWDCEDCHTFTVIEE